MPVKFYVEPNQGFIVPFGFAISKQAEIGDAAINVKPEDFHVPIKTLDSFKEMVKLGFLDDPKNKVHFTRLYSPSDSRHAYRIVFDDFDKEPRFFINVRTGTVSTKLIPQLSVSFNGFVELVMKRFESYDFTPDNGWAFMYYVDFLTNWKCSWSESDIHALDSFKTFGTSMNTLAALINLGVPVSSLSNFKGLPDSWISKIVTQNK